MTRDEFEDQQYHISFTAGMNQRYHQNVAQWWIRWNRGVQISVAVLAVMGLCLSVAAIFGKNESIDEIAIFVASLAAFAAIMLNVLPLGDWAQQHLDLLRRWSICAKTLTHWCSILKINRRQLWLNALNGKTQKCIAFAGASQR